MPSKFLPPATMPVFDTLRMFGVSEETIEALRVEIRDATPGLGENVARSLIAELRAMPDKHG